MYLKLLVQTVNMSNHGGNCDNWTRRRRIDVGHVTTYALVLCGVPSPRSIKHFIGLFP